MTEQDNGHALRRDIIEARNQAIKTDNQIKNLSMDVRNFEKRFDALESRVRLSSVGTNLLIALALAGCAYIVTSVMARAYDGEIAQLKDAVREEQQVAERKRTQLEERFATAQNQVQHAKQAGTKVLKLLDLLDKHRDHEAGELLEQVDLEALSPLERSLCATRFADLKRRQALVAFRQGRQASMQRDMPAAIAALSRSLRLDPEGPLSKPARDQLAQALWHAKRYAEAEPVMRAWLNKEPDEPTGLARYLLATSLVRMGKADAARAEFLQVAGREGSRWAPAARAYLAAMAAGSELPEDLGNGRVRVADRTVAPAPGAAPPAASAGP